MYYATYRDEWGQGQHEKRSRMRGDVLGVGPNEWKTGHKNGKECDGFYTSEAVVLMVRFELDAVSSFGEFSEPAVYKLCSLAAASKLPRYDGFLFSRSWRRIIITQKEIPRIGLACVVGASSRERLVGRKNVDVPGRGRCSRRSHQTGILRTRW
jgi:hypothetical protein